MNGVKYICLNLSKDGIDILRVGNEFMLANAENFALLDQSTPSQADLDLALKHAPLIDFDAAEPFLPLAVGCAIFRHTAPSPSFPRAIEVQNGLAIEYAIWWDWDIAHLYELEHIWLYFDPNGALVNAEASWHGGFRRMVTDTGELPLENGRLRLVSEPGKHAFAPDASWFAERRPSTLRSCASRHVLRGLLVTPLFEGLIPGGTPNENQLVHTWLERQLFNPTFEFTRRFSLDTATFAPWENLKAWIPQRVRWWLDTLDRAIPFHERRVLTIAHRGASAYAQENTAEAFHIAAGMGADLVEVDLRITADDVPVISHDDSLRRVYGVDGLISQLSFEQLREKAAVMTFDDLVQQCRDIGLGIYLDIKALSRQAARRLFEALKARHFTQYVVFSSFSPDIISEIKAAHPHVRASILFSSTAVDPVALARAVRADYVHPCWEKSAEQPHRLLTEDWLSRVRGAGLGIITWHEERPAEIAALKRLGVNGICSDRPDLVV